MNKQKTKGQSETLREVVRPARKIQDLPCILRAVSQCFGGAYPLYPEADRKCG